MKATKKQTTEVTAIAIEMNHSVEMALRTLSNCSKSIYDVIGAKGVVESSIATKNSPYTAYELKASQNTNNPLSNFNY
jgi:hypothetical protein